MRKNFKIKKKRRNYLVVSRKITTFALAKSNIAEWSSW